MVEALQDGTIDIIVSSHDPQDVDTKRLPFADAAVGAIGLETLLAVALRLHHNGDVPLMRLIEALVDRSRKAVRTARRHAEAGRQGGPGACRSRRAMDGREKPISLAFQEHLLRRRQAARQGLANLGWGRTVFSASGHRGRKYLDGEFLGDGNDLLIAAALFGYLLGSIPFGLLLTRAAGLGDVRKIGSGNIGATNVLRTGNKKLAAATLLLDALKGTVAVLIAARWSHDAGNCRRLRCLLGHLFRSGSASRAARASPPISACCLASLAGAH
jgi:hypothetical protein